MIVPIKRETELKIYTLKSCDTCRKALKTLRDEAIEFEMKDIRADGISQDDIVQILAVFGDKAVNKASATWRGLSDAEKQMELPLLIDDFPTLLKRPVIFKNGQWFHGWTPAVQFAALGR